MRIKFMSQRPAESQIPAFFPALVLLGVFVLVIVLLRPVPVPGSVVLSTTAPTTVALQPTNLQRPATLQTVAYDPALVLQGQGVFQSVCFACHGPDARGIPGLGKNL